MDELRKTVERFNKNSLDIKEFSVNRAILALMRLIIEIVRRIVIII